MSSTTPTSGASTGSPRAPEERRRASAPQGDLPARDPALRLRPERIDPLALATLPGRRLTGVIAVRGWTVIVGEPLAVITDPARLDELADRCGWREPPDRSGPPFLGGAVGYVSDDVSAAWLDLPPDPRPLRSGHHPVWLAVHDRAVCVPPDGQGAWLVAADIPGWSDTPLDRRLEELDDLVDASLRAPAPAQPAPAGAPAEPVLSLDAAAHRAAVSRVREWIAAGDLYQLNLTLQVGVGWRGPAAALARRLWQASPEAAHAAWLDTGESDVVSVSPETFLRTDGDAVAVRPIKGTRPRAGDPAADRASASELETSAKDRAEHVMIVDLERNDLGRVCEVGSVRVPELAALERHPSVWHLTSTVTGRLRPDVTLTELLGAMFPCGSVTGAPKRMAVARTRVVEPVRRGAYCGAVGVVSRGLVDLSVAIRTAVLCDGWARYGTGGGIVADSDARAEFSEAMDKARPFLEAVGASRPPSEPG